MAAFGVLGGVVQLYTAVLSPPPIPGAWIVSAVVAISAGWGVYRAYPRSSLTREFQVPDIKIRVNVGDLFDQKTHLAIGFSDTFDTDTSDGIIYPKSLQGQLLGRVFHGDLAGLNRLLDAALKSVKHVQKESRRRKPKGKRVRYPLATVATIRRDKFLYFCIAYTKMGNDLVAQSSIDDLWRSLSELWQEVHRRAHREPISIGLVGSELARIGCVNRESLLKIILLSFVAQSREEVVSRELTVVIHPSDVHHLNMLEIDAFIRSL
ncbi:macro domain-containing protein [Nocardiopsis sp. JB363]|uniref:macro domain-containing protein n=1 Tax=Nocardiopsis sp. JB363 TaxID=1434837 RepID=UPI00117EB9B5|nr:macro domain-containing protein [Nocardiopsis sp. JB363]